MIEGEQETTVEDYKRYLKRRSSTGNFFIFFRDYLEIMDLEQAVVVQSILNLGKENTTEDGWIRCTTAYMEETFKLKRDAQSRIFNSLKQMGILEYKMIGLPAKRYVKIDLEKIEKLIDQGPGNSGPLDIEESRTQRVAEPRRHICNKDNELKENADSPNGESCFSFDSDFLDEGFLAANGKKAKSPPIANQYINDADLLHKALSKNSRKKAAWRRESEGNWLRLLKEKDKQSYAPILKWYCENCSLKDETALGLPSITGAKSFRDRYAWLLNVYIANVGPIEEGDRIEVTVLPDGSRRSRIKVGD